MLKEHTITLCRDGVPLLKLYQATTWLARLKGLFAFPPLSDGEGLLIQPCNAVHTFGMKYSIDAVFLDSGGTILKVVQLDSGSVAMCWRADRVVEMKQGTASRLNLQLGQTLPGVSLCAGAVVNE